MPDTDAAARAAAAAAAAEKARRDAQAALQRAAEARTKLPGGGQ